MATPILDLTFILVITTFVVMVLRMFKQPAIVAYIISGLIVGPTVLGLDLGAGFIDTFSHIGIAFLLFLVGINLDIRSIRRVGVVSAVTGIGQVVFTSVIGYGLARLMGLGVSASVYVAVALTFSSTIIIVKLLSDNKDLDSLHGKIAIGFLVVQDIIAVFVLLFIGALTGSDGSLGAVIGQTVLEGLLLALAAWGINVYLLPMLLRSAGKSLEVLFLFSIAWCFTFAGIFSVFGFGVEIGALIAGLMLASTPYAAEIASRIRPLRDFFIIMFFIVLGMQMELAAMEGMWIPALVLSAFVLIGNPLIVVILMGVLGFSKRTSFLAGLAVAQISEFSLIIMSVGLANGHVEQPVVSMIILVGLITILGSTYLFQHSRGLFDRLKDFIPHYRRGVHKHEEKSEHHSRAYDVILFGHNRIGYSLVEHFVKKDKDFLVVDFNPEVVIELEEQGYNAMFGDANDAELYEELRFDKTQVVISTVPDMQASVLIVKHVRKTNPETVTILTAMQSEDALKLYELGADYVIIPHIVGGEHAANMLEMLFEDLETFLGKKHSHIQQLEGRGKR